MTDFRAIRISEQGKGFTCSLETLPLSALPDGEATIEIHCSALNYKDALSRSGHKGVTRNFPHTPGIDAAGVVVSDVSGKFSPGDRVLVSGFDFGMNTAGGLAEMCKVPSNWVCRCPDSLSFFSAMALGTAGITASVALAKLQRCLPLAAGDNFVVSGASGGVGQVMVKLAAHHGFKVTAISGKPHLFEHLQKLGAYACEAPELEARKKPMLVPRFKAGLDTLGGAVLTNLLGEMEQEGALAMCGMALSPELDATVYPFILRGVSLLGVDSAELALARRQKYWQQLADTGLDFRDLAHEVTLDQVPKALDDILAGKGEGRRVVRIR